MASSDLAWKKLLAAQEKIRAQQKEARERMVEMMAKLDRLDKQDNLLRKRAGEFIQTDIKDVEELERLEEEEERKRAEGQKKLAEQQKASEAIAAAFEQFPSDPTNADSFDPVLFDQLVRDIPESYLDNSGA
jgi:hypothetical protein